MLQSMVSQRVGHDWATTLSLFIVNLTTPWSAVWLLYNTAFQYFLISYFLSSALLSSVKTILWTRNDTLNILHLTCEIFDTCVCMHAKLLQSCPTLCNPMECSPPGSSAHGILQAKNTGVGCHAFLQGIFQTQRSNSRLLCLLHWQASSSHKK